MPRLPSARMPAPSMLALPPCRLPAAMAVCRPAVIDPSLTRAPAMASVASLPPRIAPALVKDPARIDRSVAAPMDPPAVLTAAPATWAVSAPALATVPRALSRLPPTDSAASVSLVSVPSWLTRSPVVAMFRLPACNFPRVFSKRPTSALKAPLTLSEPPAFEKLGPAMAMLATLNSPPALLMLGACSAIAPAVWMRPPSSLRMVPAAVMAPGTGGAASAAPTAPTLPAAAAALPDAAPPAPALPVLAEALATAGAAPAGCGPIIPPFVLLRARAASVRPAALVWRMVPAAVIDVAGRAGQFDPPAFERAADVRQVALGRNLQPAAAGNGAAVGYAGCAQARIARRLDRADVLQPPVGPQDQAAGARLDRARTAHPQARLGAHQKNVAGIHPAQCRDVECKDGLVACSGNGRDLFVVGTDLVGTGDHLEPVGPDGRIDSRRPRQDRRVVGLGQVQSGAVDGDGAPAHDEAVEAAQHVELWRSGGQRGLGGVDEAAAVDLDAARVGDDDLGALAGHFHMAAQVRGRIGVDLVDDDACRPARQPWIAGRCPAQLGLHVRAAVVEDHALCADVERANRHFG